MSSPSTGLAPSPADLSLGGIWARGPSSLDLPAVSSPPPWCRCSPRARPAASPPLSQPQAGGLQDGAQAQAFTAR